MSNHLTPVSVEPSPVAASDAIAQEARVRVLREVEQRFTLVAVGSFAVAVAAFLAVGISVLS